MASTQDASHGAASAGTAGGRSTAAAVKAGPVLPWMRVPITIESGTGVPIEGVLGMDQRLVPVLLKGRRGRGLHQSNTRSPTNTSPSRRAGHSPASIFAVNHPFCTPWVADIGLRQLPSGLLRCMHHFQPPTKCKPMLGTLRVDAPPACAFRSTTLVDASPFCFLTTIYMLVAQRSASRSCSRCKRRCGSTRRAAAAPHTTCVWLRPQAAARRWRTRCRWLTRSLTPPRE